MISVTAANLYPRKKLIFRKKNSWKKGHWLGLERGQMANNLVEIIDSTTRETKTQKMKTAQLWKWKDTNLKVKVKIGGDGVGVDNGSMLMVRFLGQVARKEKYCPIDIYEWPNRPQSIKDKQWALIKDKFSFDYDAGKRWALSTLGDRWRHYKYQLRDKYLNSNKSKEEILENLPSGVDKVQWSKFVDHYMTNKMKELSEKNTANRKKLKINHTGGSKSNQRKAHEMEMELRRRICRAEVVVPNWVKKDGSYSSEYARNLADKILKHLPLDQERAATYGVPLEIYAHPYDAIGKVCGLEHPGRVRGLGIGICPSRKFQSEFGLKLKKKLLVLDINGVLADIQYDESGFKFFNPDKSIRNHSIFVRPFCREFLEFCFEYFEVAIWSSKESNNVRDVIDYLLGDMKNNLLFFWDASKCTKSRRYTPENQKKHIVFKDLSNVWDYDRCRSLGFDATNTLLVDDSPYKALLNPPHTAVFPHTYHYWNSTDNALAVGGELREYLDGLAKDINVQEYVRTRQFGQAGIDEENKHWWCYREAIRNLQINK